MFPFKVSTSKVVFKSLTCSPQIFVVVRHSREAKSQILSFKICEELSAEQNLESQQILSLQNSPKVEKQRTVHQRFFSQRVRLFVFLLCRITTEAMGTGGLREHSLSHSDKVNAGAKPAKCTSASL
jgi:hypothetical protein